MFKACLLNILTSGIITLPLNQLQLQLPSEDFHIPQWGYWSFCSDEDFRCQIRELLYIEKHKSVPVFINGFYQEPVSEPTIRFIPYVPKWKPTGPNFIPLKDLKYEHRP